MNLTDLTFWLAVVWIGCGVMRYRKQPKQRLWRCLLWGPIALLAWYDYRDACALIEDREREKRDRLRGRGAR